MTLPISVNPYAPPVAAVEDISSERKRSEDTPFFAVSVIKLLVMSICTFGFYELYWFYQNWRRIKMREQRNILPVARALFTVIFCYPCFTRIRDYEAPSNKGAALAAGPLAIGWILTTMMANLRHPYGLISLLAPLFLLPVQAHVNRINALVAPDQPNERFTGWNWVAVVVGGLFFALMVVAAFLPDQ